MVWGYFINQRFNTPEMVKELYNDPRVLTADEILRDDKGIWHVKQ